MTKLYKFALFDWDGCLADTLSQSRDICYQLANQKSIDFNDDTYREIVGDWAKAAQALNYPDANLLKQDYTDLMEKNILELRLNPNAEKILRLLHDHRIVIGIATSSSRLSVQKQVNHLNISAYIQTIVGIEDVINPKPHPEAFEKLMHILGADAPDSLVIGDTEKDIIAAGGAGIDSVWYAPASNKAIYGELDFETYSPTHIISDFNELAQFFTAE